MNFKSRLSTAFKDSYIFILLLILTEACENPRPASFLYIQPDYRQIDLTPTADTLEFLLPKNTYGGIRSCNYFTDRDREYISLYDKQSLSVNIYSFKYQSLIRRAFLNDIFPYRRMDKHTTVFCKNLDSLFIINDLKMYLINRRNKVIDSIEFPTKPIIGFPSFSSDNPPIFLGKKIYTTAHPALSVKKKIDIRKWKSLFMIDLTTKETSLVYNFPETYKNKVYGIYLVRSSFCGNEKGNIVFSFPADTNIYETDLGKSNMAYLGKSSFHNGGIKEVSKEEFDEENGMKKSFLVRDSYDRIFYDPYRKIYLRIAESKLTEREYTLGSKEKNRSLIFMDSTKKIIGESKLKSNVDLSSPIFSIDGGIYTLANMKADSVVGFVKLEYHSLSNPN